MRIGLFCLKWAILFLSLNYCGYLYTSMVLKHQAEERNPTRKEITRNHIKQKVVRLAICVDIRRYLTSDEDLDLSRLNKTMSEIEKTTNGALDDNLEGIHLSYQERMFRADYTAEPKVLFKKVWSVYRCFILPIFPDYQLMSSDPKLIIKFKKNSYPKLYLLTENETLSKETFEFSESAFMKRVVKRLESSGECVNYRDRYANCKSRLHCIEQCINRETLEKFKKITFGDKAVVDKDQCSLKKWSTTYPMQIPFSGPNLNTYTNICYRCTKKFQNKPPCLEVTFDETVEIAKTDLQTKEIDLYLDVELSIEEFTWFNLLLNLLNIQSIFFGMTILRLLRMIYNFIKSKLTIRNEKMVQFLIYLLCSLGFTWHTYRIFDQSINEQLSYNPNYETANRIRMPFVMFCLPVEEKLIDRNHQLTGNYLEKLTSEITAESLFESITYLDELNEWIPFNLSLVERFFYMRSKCFRITIDREYDRRQFYFSINNQVLKVNFSKWFWNQEKEDKTLFFMTKTNETGFSNVANLIYHSGVSRKQYSAEQSEFTIRYEDRLRFMKRFLSTSYEDDFGDLDRQLRELNSSEFSFRTLKVPVEKGDFDFELRDDLFDQLFTKANTETAHNSMDDSDYYQTFVFNQLKQITYSHSHFTSSLSLIKRTIYAKNEENLAKLVLNLLNALFLWFDLGILDLHPIFILSHDYLLVYLYLHWPVYLLTKITRFVFLSHRWLKKFERPLYIRLHARRLRVPKTRRLMFV